MVGPPPGASPPQVAPTDASATAVSGGAPANPWDRHAATQAQVTPDKSYSSTILPLSRDAQGNVRFDSNAGLVGDAKRFAETAWDAFKLPGQVYQGQIDPTSPEGIARAAQFATVFTTASAAANAGERMIPGVAKAFRQGATAAPSEEALYAAADAGYKASRNMGVEYSSDSIKQLADSVRAKLMTDGIMPGQASGTHEILDHLSTPPANSTVPLAGIESAYSGLGKIGQNFNNPTDQLAAGKVRDALHDFVSVADPSTVVAGPATDAAKVWDAAKGNYAAASHSDKLTSVDYTAGLRAKAANSGLNLDNSIRSRIASLLSTPKGRSGFSPDEIALLEQVTNGTPTRNAIRFAGNLFGGGGGLGGVVAGTVGGAATGLSTGNVLKGLIVGGGIPATGLALKTTGNALTRRALNTAEEAVRSRSPLFSQMGQNAPMTLGPVGAQAALVKALLMPGSGSANNGTNQPSLINALLAR